MADFADDAAEVTEMNLQVGAFCDADCLGVMSLAG